MIQDSLSSLKEKSSQFLSSSSAAAATAPSSSSSSSYSPVRCNPKSKSTR
jgi:hypothetical protein